MKALYIILLASVLGFGAQAQTRTIYYNNFWEIVPKEEASYYRICQLDSNNSPSTKSLRWFIGNVTDFSMDGKLVMKGSYKSTLANGEFTFYYPNGQIQATGSFENGSRIGIWKYFFKNGQLEHEVKFALKQKLSLQTEFFPVSAYDSMGKQVLDNGTGQWHFEYVWYGAPEVYIVTGKFEKGKKEDLWICTLSTGQVLYREFYKNNKFINGIFMNGTTQEKLEEPFNNKIMLPYKFDVTEKFVYKIGTNQKHYPFLPFLKDELTLDEIKPSRDSTYWDTNDETVFYAVEQQAEFSGGLVAMMKFIQENLVYPQHALKMGIEGKVFVKFIVGRDGSITDTEIVKGVHPQLDEEAIRVVSIFPKWIPGKQHGRPVRSQFILPIIFKLDK